MKKIIIFIFMVLIYVSDVSAQTDTLVNSDIGQLKSQMQQMQEQFEMMKNQYEQKLEEMQNKIQRMENERISSESQGNYQEEIDSLKTKIASLQDNSQSESQNTLLKSFNPEISVIGDVIYKSTDVSDDDEDDNFSFRELELVFSSNIDTYARGDVFLAVENEDGSTEVALEEAYLTLLQTPLENLQGKFGKFRPNFGKANRLHLHAMPWVDYPKVVVNYLGEEGFSEAGVSLNYLIPNPADIYSEVSLEIINSNDSEVFGGANNAEVSYLAHWKNFYELNDKANIEIGASHILGDNDEGGGSKTYLSGADLTFNWEPEQFRKWTSQTEAFFSKKEQMDEDNIDSWGMYSSLEHQLAKRWSAFTRYDFSQTPDASSTESYGYTGGIKFAQSEYAFWRLQFTHTDNKQSEDANEVWLQLNFGMGPHRAHTY